MAYCERLQGDFKAFFPNARDDYSSGYPLIKASTICFNFIFTISYAESVFSLCLNRANSWIIKQISVSLLSLRVKAAIVEHQFYNFTTKYVMLSSLRVFIWWDLVVFCLYVSKLKTFELIQSSKAVTFHREKPGIHV